MTLQITLPPELEATLQRRAAAAGQDVATFVQAMVSERLAEEEESESYRPLPHDEFRRWLDDGISLHPAIAHAVDDSRESIYAGRGE